MRADLSILMLLLPWVLLACSAPPSGGEPDAEAARRAWPDAAGGVADVDLATLSRDLWEEMLRADPVFASNLGDERYLGRLRDVSPAGLATRRERLIALQVRAQSIDAGRLAPQDRVTLDLLREELERALIFHDAHLEEWLVDPRGAPHIEIMNLVEDQPSRTAQERALMIERWAAMPTLVNQATANLLRGAGRGRYANRSSIETAIAQVDRLLAVNVDEWPLGSPPLDPGLSALDRRVLLESLRAGLRDSLRPALAHYRDVLRDRLLPRARSDEQPGLASLSGGVALYDRLILAHTGLPLTAQELHDFGLVEVARIRHEMAVLGERVFADDAARAAAEVAAGAEAELAESGAAAAVAAREAAIVAMVQQRLRNDASLHFSTREEVQAAAERALSRAAAATPRWFGLQPPVPCEVVRIAPHEERDTTIAYYREPAADGSRPGRYYINTYAPETRPRYEAEVLALHEAIPGHHLQISIAQELSDLPRFRREGGPTAYVEGWALYTERLGEEMALYSGDTDRLGVLSFDAWRACRLVVDTGMHAFGWSRQQAIDYMLANTLLAPNNIANEVDRYITSPGQALAYKTGQRELLALRAQAERQLDAAFDIKGFHDVVLGSGAVSLPVLRRNVEAWIAAQGR